MYAKREIRYINKKQTRVTYLWFLSMLIPTLSRWYPKTKIP